AICRSSGIVSACRAGSFAGARSRLSCSDVPAENDLRWEVGMPRGTGPTVRRRRPAAELRRLREAADLTIDEVASKLECSASKISRIETGHVGVTPRDARDMLELYGVSGNAREELVQLAREARTRGWW